MLIEDANNGVPKKILEDVAILSLCTPFFRMYFSVLLVGILIKCNIWLNLRQLSNNNNNKTD
jgi:hypothetical protein